MPVFHLDLEIDSSAYPELHQMLSAVGNPSLRAERVRQLATTGLIWERLRLASGASDEAAFATEMPMAMPSLELVRAANPPRREPLGLPVLRDEVPDSELSRAGNVERPPTATPEAPPLAGPASAEAVPASVGALMDSAPSAQMSGTRSRLMRMKRRGLFTNE